MLEEGVNHHNGEHGDHHGRHTNGGEHYDSLVMATLPKLVSDGTKTVSGKVTSYGKSSEATVIQLFAPGSDEVAYETMVNGLTANYSISGIAAGTYTMHVSKTKHATCEYTITVGNADIQKNVTLYLLGDVNIDGEVDALDATQITRYSNGKPSIFDAK